MTTFTLTSDYPEIVTVRSVKSRLKFKINVKVLQRLIDYYENNRWLN